MDPVEQRIAEARSRIESKAPAGLERRSAELRFVEVRDHEDDDGFEFKGYAAVFDSLSEDLGGFREEIKRGAFRKSLADDVRLLVNHNPDLLLARTTSGTLRLEEDTRGLRVSADIADTQAGRDLRVLVERGDMSQMSFAFTVLEDEWDEGEDGLLVRKVTRVRALYDVSAVTYPAYPASQIDQNSLSPETPEPTPEGRAQEPGDEAGESAVAGDEMESRKRLLRIREHETALA